MDLYLIIYTNAVMCCCMCNVAMANRAGTGGQLWLYSDDEDRIQLRNGDRVWMQEQLHCSAIPCDESPPQRLLSNCRACYASTLTLFFIGFFFKSVWNFLFSSIWRPKQWRSLVAIIMSQTRIIIIDGSLLSAYTWKSAIWDIAHILYTNIEKLTCQNQKWNVDCLLSWRSSHLAWVHSQAHVWHADRSQIHHLHLQALITELHTNEVSYSSVSASYPCLTRYLSPECRSNLETYHTR